MVTPHLHILFFQFSFLFSSHPLRPCCYPFSFIFFSPYLLTFRLFFPFMYFIINIYSCLSVSNNPLIGLPPVKNEFIILSFFRLLSRYFFICISTQKTQDVLQLPLFLAYKVKILLLLFLFLGDWYWDIQ
jgi:hypothetical protein